MGGRLVTATSVLHRRLVTPPVRRRLSRPILIPARAKRTSAPWRTQPLGAPAWQDVRIAGWREDRSAWKLKFLRSQPSALSTSPTSADNAKNSSGPHHGT